MSKIFLVTSGDYSEYSVAAAFSTRDLAEHAVAEGIGDNIEEMVVDPKIEPKPDRLQSYVVTISNDNISCVVRQESPYGYHADDGSFPLRWPAPGEIAEHGTNEHEYFYRNFRCWAANSTAAMLTVQRHREALLAAGKWPHVDPPKPRPSGLITRITGEMIVTDGTSDLLQRAKAIGQIARS